MSVERDWGRHMLTCDFRASRSRMEKCSAVGRSDVSCRIYRQLATTTCLPELTIRMPCHVARDNANTPALEFNLASVLGHQTRSVPQRTAPHA